MLKQNTLAEATTELGFAAETNTPLTREVTLEDNTVVKVEGITPYKMKEILKSEFVTPGEKYFNNGIDLNGVVQNYNEGARLVVPEYKKKSDIMDGDTIIGNISATVSSEIMTAGKGMVEIAITNKPESTKVITINIFNETVEIYPDSSISRNNYLTDITEELIDNLVNECLSSAVIEENLKYDKVIETLEDDGGNNTASITASGLHKTMKAGKGEVNVVVNNISTDKLISWNGSNIEPGTSSSKTIERDPVTTEVVDNIANSIVSELTIVGPTE